VQSRAPRQLPDRQRRKIPVEQIDRDAIDPKKIANACERKNLSR